MANKRTPDGELARSLLPGLTVAEVVDRELKACLDHAAEGLHFVGRDGTIKLWDADSGALLWTLPGHDQSVVSVTFSPASRIVKAVFISAFLSS